MPLQNPQANGIRITGVALLLCLLLPLLAQGLGADPLFAWILGLVGALVCLIILPILYVTGRRYLREIAALVGGESIVHWELERFDWERYVSAEWQRSQRAARQTALWTGGIGLAIALVVGFFGGDLSGALLWIGGGFLLLAALLGGMLWWLGQRTYQKRLAGNGEVYIGPKGALNAGTYHSWAGFGVKLEAVRLVESDPAEVVFTIRTEAGENSSTNDVHIPVPRGREEEAAKLVASYYAEV